jgi:spore coat polysaccharide biosynthesis protein SpsF (cytidylyltransferase family)
MRYLVIIQARCGSSRLPGKVLKDIYGKTALERMIDRVGKSKIIDEIIIATTINKEDIRIINLISSLGLRVFAGSSDDVLDRYYQVARLLRPDNLIRLTSDCPLFDYEILDEAINLFEEEKCDYLGMISETFPDGLDLEIMKYCSLESAWNRAVLASEREHVTLYIKNHPEMFNIYDYQCKIGDFRRMRWTLDEDKDLIFIKRVYKYFIDIGKDYFSMKEIIEYLNNNPEVETINSGIVRNEGLLKSLKNDKVVIKKS